VFEGMFGLDKMVSIVLIAGLTGLYTIVGGLMAVMMFRRVLLSRRGLHFFGVFFFLRFAGPRIFSAC